MWMKGWASVWQSRRERERMRREWRIDENRLWHIGMRDGLLTVDHWNVSAAHKTSSDSFSWSNYPPQPDIWDVEPVRRNRWTEQLLADESEARCALSLLFFPFLSWEHVMFSCLVFRLPPLFPLHASLSFFSPLRHYVSLSAGDRRRLLRRLQLLYALKHTDSCRNSKKKKSRVCMCMQVRESRLSRKGELCVSMQFNARVWSRDCLLSATTSVCMLWRQITQLLITDRFVIFLQRLV